MRILRSNFVFPSYNQIKKEITQKQSKDYEMKIQKLNSKLNAMKRHNDFKVGHQKIKESIIALSREDILDKSLTQKQNIRLQNNHKSLFSHGNNNESLNYYIQDDKEEENNFETYLKFKKKALERDLQQDQPQILTCKEKKKQQEEQEQLFRKLYTKQDDVQISYLTKCKGIKNNKSNSIDYKSAKQNASKFIQKIENMTSKIAQRQKRSLRTSNIKFKQEDEAIAADLRQKKVYEKNKKFLTQNYMDILRKLEGTNIVKWRILNEIDSK